MLAYTYIKNGTFQMMEKPVPEIKDPRDAVVRVTLGSICTSDLHIKHGSVPRAVPGITVGHEMVGIVERVGEKVTSVKPGDRVTVNVETFYNPQIQISAESETKRSIFREKDKTKRSKKESAQHSKSRNKSFVMTSVSAL